MTKHSQTSWLQLRILTSPEIEDALVNRIFELGSCGCQQIAGAIVAYFSQPEREAEIRLELQNYIAELKSLGLSVPAPKIESSLVPWQDWNSNWKEHFSPVTVSDKIIVTPSWRSVVAKPGQIVIEIDPKQAFGTGTHETTQMALRELENHLSSDDFVLDVGTGTGILAIAAAKLGARSVIALDFDLVATEAALENVHANEVAESVHLVGADIGALAEGAHFDLILANINRTEIERMLPALTNHLAGEGHLVITGVLLEEGLTMQTSAAKSGLRTVKSCTRGEWLALVLTKERTT